MASPDFRFDGVVRLTRLGGGYLLFTLIVGFAALNTGNNALYITLSFMLGILVVSGIASKAGLRRIEIELVDIGEAWVDRPASTLLRVRNVSRLWTVRDIVVVSDEMEQPEVIPIVPRRKEALVSARRLFRRRGRVSLHRIDLYTRYPFGLFVKKRQVPMTGDAIVYPRLLDHSVVPETWVSQRGELASTQRSGFGSDVFAFREYAPGDSIRLFHWKKSASLGRWIVRQTAEESTRSLRIAVDDTLPPGMAPEAFETMLSEVATSLNEAFQQGVEVTLLLPGRRLHGNDAETRRLMLESLALLESRPAGEVPEHDPGVFVFSLRDHEAKSA